MLQFKQPTGKLEEGFTILFPPGLPIRFTRKRLDADQGFRFRVEMRSGNIPAYGEWDQLYSALPDPSKYIEAIASVSAAIAEEDAKRRAEAVKAA